MQLIFKKANKTHLMCLEMHNFIGANCLNRNMYHLEEKLQCCDLQILSSVLPWRDPDFFCFSRCSISYVKV